MVYPNLSATVYGVVTIDDQPAETGDVVGFFVGSELRFKGPVVVSDGKAYVLGLMNAAGGPEIFTFKVYDDSANAVYPVPDISLGAGPGSIAGPDPLFEIKASSGLGIEERLAQMTAARDAAIEERDARPTQAAYDAIVEERDARFVDTDGDGITDVKEGVLGSDTAEANVFYLKDAYDLANAQSVLAGKNEVVADPGSFGLITDAQYQAIVAERDARFVDTDGDGLTDVKEGELETDLAFETRFYLQAAYDSAIIQYLSEGRKAGQSDVTGNPSDFDLTTIEAYNTVVAERDANLVTYTAALTEKDGVIGGLNESITEKVGAIATLNESIAKKDGDYAALVTERDTDLATYTTALTAKDGVIDANLATYTTALAAKDGVIGDLNESIAKKTLDYEVVVEERDANLATYTTALAEKDGAIATLNDSIAEKDAANTTLVAE
ncbi:hypothetical protein OAL53_04375, partial [Akkermansiaceae bacterium]|nr:hypothetical protein [Akkermansiaceae bacterium]